MHFRGTLAASLLLVGNGLAAKMSSDMAGMMATSTSAVVVMAASSTVAAGMGMETVHVVQVGQNGTLTFSPNNVIAKAGDLVQFQFNPKNHSVVQSTFANPCVPIQNIMPNKTDAFFSGFMPTNSTAASGKNVLTYTVRVMDTTPIWIYCSQGMHCQSGMVGAINAATSGNKTVAAFAALAAKAPQNLSPGQNANGTVASAGASSAAAATRPAATSMATSAASAGANGGATSAASAKPAQQTTNAAPGRLLDAAKNGFMGIAYAGVAAYLVL